MKELFSSDNLVLITRVSALFAGGGLDFYVLDGHASLFGGGIEGIARRVMVPPESVAQAKRLIREAGLADDVDFSDDIR
ncbi:DUF2007 domain-containing protein [Emcibacter sp.]|uniref:putative signal transducing protein n=1 Tax=Emcibacter sp. TaxID=1979954 RepID=UPI002AA8772B|nr:DUF2007 domain-containing protein [Emcibacter sp.]